jgi:soluble lytic murein transglycosylase-like protein
MPSATLGTGFETGALGSLPRLPELSPVTSELRRRLLSPSGITLLALFTFLAGMLVTAARAPSNAEVESLESALFAQAAQLAQLRDQLAISEAEGNRLLAVQRFSTEYEIPADLAAAIYGASLSEGLRPELAFQLVKIESGFRRTAVSSAGAVGLTQLKPSTAQWVDPTTTGETLWDTGTNLRVGFRYLSILLSQYSGNERLALLAYNRGPGRVGELLARGKDPANGYARRVLAH